MYLKYVRRFRYDGLSENVYDIVQRHHGCIGANGIPKFRYCPRNPHCRPTRSGRNLYVSRILTAAASEAMPPVPPQMLPRISTISPTGGERSNAADAHRSPPPSKRHSRATECARLIPVTNRRRLMAKPCTPHLHCAACAALQAANSQCRGSRGTPLAFLWGIKRGYSLRKENTPFDKAAPIQTSILTPCVSMVMMHPAMVTPSRMTGTARFRRISSTAAMSAPVHAPVPGSGMATKSSSPHVW